MWQYLLKPYFSRAAEEPGVRTGRDTRCDPPLPRRVEKPTDDTIKSPTVSPFQAFYTEPSPDRHQSRRLQGRRRLRDAPVSLQHGAEDRPVEDQQGFLAVVYPQANFWTIQRMSAKKQAPIRCLRLPLARSVRRQWIYARRVLAARCERVRPDELHRDPATWPGRQRGIRRPGACERCRCRSYGRSTWRPVLQGARSPA
jgi:hypothetical protein